VTGPSIFRVEPGRSPARRSQACQSSRPSRSSSLRVRSQPTSGGIPVVAIPHLVLILILSEVEPEEVAPAAVLVLLRLRPALLIRLVRDEGGGSGSACRAVPEPREPPAYTCQYLSPPGEECKTRERSYVQSVT
jgi:hypothetical protein